MKGPAFSEETLSAIDERTGSMRREENIRVEVRVVEEIPRGATGKLCTVVAKVQPR